MKLGIAFSGGGVRSAAQLGIVKALRENGIHPEIFTGTSGGSIVAALLAQGIDPDDALELLMEAQDVLDIAYLNIIKGIFTKSKIEGLFKGARLEKALYKIFGPISINNVDEILAIVTTDIVKGQQVIFSNYPLYKPAINDDDYALDLFSGERLYEIIRASCGLPGVFIPKQLGGRTLVDGGLVNNLPSDVAVALGADRVISIELGYYGENFKIGGIYSIVGQAFDIIYHRAVENNLKSFDILLNPKVYDVGILDTHQAQNCYNRGYEYGLSVVSSVQVSLSK